MHIIYIHQYFRTRSMYGGTRSFEQARRLVARGHRVDVLTTDTTASGGSFSWRVTIEDGVRVHWLPVPYSNTMGFAPRMRAFLHFAVLGSVRATRLGGDVVFATSTPLTVVIPGVIAARLRRTRFVFEVRDLWPEWLVEIGALRNPVAIRLAYALARTAYRHASNVVALSDGMADGVAAHGYPRDRISVVPNACDVDLFASAEEEGERFRQSRPWLQKRPLVVYTGSLGVVNGIGYLVQLAAAVARLDPEIRFLVVGSGAEYPRVRRMAAELDVLERNFFLERAVPKSDVPAILGAATMATCVLLPVPSLAANSANKFFDALAAGRPVAVNFAGWQSEVLLESGAGLMLDPNDIQRAAQDVAVAVRDGEWLSTARSAARRLALERYSRDELFETLVRALTGEDRVSCV